MPCPGRAMRPQSQNVTPSILDFFDPSFLAFPADHLAPTGRPLCPSHGTERAISASRIQQS
ncbi:protein of unknown function (plasmid) [Rhodovastum atsumiense]|nr:protein of unknown function [Rhodovastum atsumiense]